MSKTELIQPRKSTESVISGSDETSEPQPIPPLLLGSDKEWLTLDPHVVRYWVSNSGIFLL